MDVANTERGKKKLNIFTEKRKDVSFGGTLVDLDPWGPCSSTWTLALEGPGHHHHDPRCHPELGFSFWRNL
jgi:hypothetical protein